MSKVFIIAEAGVNHNGSIVLAKQLIDKAKEAGVDCVKFQTWQTELLVDQNTSTAKYQEINTSQTSQYEMLKSLELSYEQFLELKDYCQKVDIQFLSTPDEYESAKFLNKIQDIFKIGSAELDNVPYLRQIGAFGKPVILSTGMGTIAEIKSAISFLKEGGLENNCIHLLHATTQYPTPFNEVNLLAMKTLMHEFPSHKVGYSDHTMGITVPIAAVALGASIIEKHFTLDTSLPGPDHRCSLSPIELKQMVKGIREAELSLGNSDKSPTESELENMSSMRKKILSSTEIARGELFSPGNLLTRRSDDGLPASAWDQLIGKKSKHHYSISQPINKDEI